MKKITKFSYVIMVGITLMASPIFGANYFLVFSEDCMQRMEFSYEETRLGNEFVLYSINVGDGQKIMLEVGLESKAPVRTLNPDVLLNCDGAQQLFVPGLAEKVNNKIDQIYIVTPVNLGQQYRVATVNSASFYAYDGQRITANTQQYRFDYDTEIDREGDLSAGDPRGNVYFMDNLELGPCQVVEFRQVYGRENNFMEIYVIPNIGVVEEKSSIANTSFRLTKINNTPFEDYVMRNCGMVESSTQNYESEQPQAYGDPNVLTPRSGQVITQPVERLSHIVSKGETLFGITKEYDITLQDLKLWNNLSTNVIYPGDQLFVSAPPVQNTDLGDFTTKGVDVQSYSDPSVLQQQPSANGQPAWTQKTGRHVVQNGETVQSIARLYGFTEERFRYFNSLGPTERIKEGDILRTIDGASPNTQFQSKGVSSYSEIPNSSNSGVQNYNNQYDYTNAQNEAYVDPYNDFDRNYPEEYQVDPQATNNNNTQDQGLQSYSFPPGTTPKSPAVNAANDNFYSPSNYGPVPGRYNNNDPLREPIRYSTNPLDRNQQNGNYSNYEQPQDYSDNTVTKGISETYVPEIPFTGVTRMHTVREGETLQTIARRYGISVQRLRALNQMDKNEVVIPFQQIYVQR
ncbi:MAG: LysM peptidoglycan-binding domain-containing protein [Bacteroidota bacterium]